MLASTLSFWPSLPPRPATPLCFLPGSKPLIVFSSHVHFTVAERSVLSCCLFAFVSFVPCVLAYPGHHSYLDTISMTLVSCLGDLHYDLKKCFGTRDQSLKTITRLLKSLSRRVKDGNLPRKGSQWCFKK